MAQHIDHKTIVVFGSTGDLSVRKLFPSLYGLSKDGLIPDSITMIAFGRRAFSNNDYHKFLEEKITELYPNLIQNDSWQKFISTIKYFKGTFDQPDDFRELGTFIHELDKENTVSSEKIFYMAISPDQYEEVIKGVEILQEENACHKKTSKVVIEKPFGRDLPSFKALNSQVLSVFEERSVYRIDHYLGKDTIRNILYIRSLNPILRNLCCGAFVKQIDVHAFESVGIGSRGSYYDRFGQLKDMVQSHLLQVFALSTIELDETFPETLISGIMPVLSDQKADILSRLSVVDVAKDCLRGQYEAGVVQGKPLRSYREEQDVPSDSDTETYVALKATLNLPQWNGTEINFRTGKALKEKLTEVVFHVGSPSAQNANIIRLRLQPDEGMSLSLYVKSPRSMQPRPVELSFDYRTSFESLLSDEYENILLDVIRSDRSSFISTEELVASWKFIDSITTTWDAKTTLNKYPAGIDPMEI